MAITLGKKKYTTTIDGGLSFAVHKDNLIFCHDAQQSTGSTHWPDACITQSSQASHSVTSGKWGAFNTGSSHIQNMGGTTRNSGGPTLNSVSYTSKNKLKYFTFDGSQDWFLMTQNSCGSDSGSLVTWAKTSTSDKYILSVSDGGPAGLGFGINTSSQISTTYYSGARGWMVASGSSDVCDGEWHQFVWSYGGSKIKHYLDGNLETTTTELTRSSAGGQWGAALNCIGRNWSGRYFNGDIAYIALYEEMVSDENISRMFDAQRHRFNV